jgi:hypothetical protein
MGEFFQETIDNHRATFDPSNIRDLIDTYLAEIQLEKEAGRGESLFEGRDHGENHLYLNTFCINWTNNATCKLRCIFMLKRELFLSYVSISEIQSKNAENLIGLGYIFYMKSII